MSETLISSFDEIYFLNFSDYFDKNWLNISYLEDSAINISEHEYKNFADALNISYLYEIREIEDDNGNKQTYFRRRMTKDQRHILLLFIQAWHGYRKEHKIKSKTGDNSYIPLRELNKFIKDNFEKDFSAKKHGFSSMIKALKATFPLEVIEKEDYLIRPKYF